MRVTENGLMVGPARHVTGLFRHLTFCLELLNGDRSLGHYIAKHMLSSHPSTANSFVSNLSVKEILLLIPVLTEDIRLLKLGGFLKEV